MQYIVTYLHYAAMGYIDFFALAYIVYSLARRRMPCRKVSAWLIPVAIVYAAIHTVFIYLYHAGAQTTHLFRMLLCIIDIMIYTLWVCFLFRDTDKKKGFFYASTTLPFVFLIWDIGSITQFIAVNVITGVINIKGSALLQDILELLLAIAVTLLVEGMFIIAVRLVSKTKFWRNLQAFIDYPKLYIPMGIIYFLYYIIFVYYGPQIMPIQWYAFCLTVPYLVLLAVVVFMVNDIKRTETLNAAQSLLLQQQNYISRLETIQREIRTIQHDYKNMLAGLYAQASEGNAEAVKEYIDTKLLKVDETVRDELMQMNQVTQIEIPELKGLIMTKMLEAEQDQVPFRLEVMFPVSRASIATEDLLRCVGILLDNAVEEARTQKDAVVTLLLLQEDSTLTIVVKNPLQGKPDLSQIRNEGYSTKGPGRGIGLFNYQNILQKYRNVTQETKIDGEYFVQVLILAESH